MICFYWIVLCIYYLGVYILYISRVNKQHTPSYYFLHFIKPGSWRNYTMVKPYDRHPKTNTFVRADKTELDHSVTLNDTFVKHCVFSENCVCIFILYLYVYKNV
jgi:hypothetical protein